MTGSKKTKVLIFDAEYDESMDRIVEKILSEFPLDWKNKNVLVKPNILSASKPEDAVTTHPVLVKTVVNKLKSIGANVTVGDNPGMYGYGKSDRAAKVSGIKDAAEDSFVHIAQNPVKYPMTSKFFDFILMSKNVLEADIIVNLPKLKTHGLTFYTGAVKNTFGYVVGGDKARVHSVAKTPRKFAEALIDIYQVKPPQLNIMDAVDAMEGNGPSHGNVRRVGKVIASDNAVSLDAVAVHLIGKNPKTVPHLDIAEKRGLGIIDISEISVDGDLSPVKNFKMPSTFAPGITGLILNRLLSRWVNCIPEIVEENCKKCSACVKYCPVEAMKISDEYPEVEKNKCISCYCCQELCPEDAIKLSGRMIRLIRSTSR